MINVHVKTIEIRKIYHNCTRYIFAFRIANDYESHSIEALANPERHLANPVNAFLLVKRFTTDWAAIQENFIRGNASDGKFM